MENSNAPEVYGVLFGPQVKHSFSPAMHNAAFKALGLPAEYRKFEKTPQELADFLRTLSVKNIYGLNVTMPYKEKVLPFLDWTSPEVTFIGACNTIIVKKNGRLEGWNTDGIGFYNHLKNELRYDFRGKKIIILGAGGAAKAVTDQLGRYEAKQLAVYDVDHSKAQVLVNKLNSEFPAMRTDVASSVESLDLHNTDLLINATPVGMKPGDPCFIEEERLHDRIFVYDLIYIPSETELLKRAKRKGAKVSNGLGMLLYQGARSFEIWTGKKAPVDVMREALEEEIKKI